MHIVLSKLSLHAYNSCIQDLQVDTDYCFLFTGDEKCEQNTVNWLNLSQMK